MRGQRRTARQTPPGARPNRDATMWPASRPGRLLEWRGDASPRGMTAHDRTRLIGRLRPLFTGVIDVCRPNGVAADDRPRPVRRRHARPDSAWTASPVHRPRRPAPGSTIPETLGRRFRWAHRPESHSLAPARRARDGMSRGWPAIVRSPLRAPLPPRGRGDRPIRRLRDAPTVRRCVPVFGESRAANRRMTRAAQG